jgi:hypothetical protein
MAETRVVAFAHRELAEILIRHQGIREGLWGVYFEFRIGAANVNVSPASDDLVPAAIIPVSKVGIQRFDEPNSLTVDAAKVNPAGRPPARRSRPATSSER